MDGCPRNLRITCTPQGNVERLECTAVLRALPGRRTVYDACWQGRNVIVKVFSCRFRARYHVRREWRGLQELRDRGMDAPAGLLQGRTDAGDWAIVIDKIADARSLRDSLVTAGDPAAAREDALQFCRELARCHDKGVLQTDPNLSNFLIRDGRIVAIDPGQIRFQSRPVGRARGLSHLAEVLSGLPQEHRPSTGLLLREYLHVRGWRPQPSDETVLETLVQRHKRQAIERALRKYQRENTRHVEITTGGCRALFDRAFCRGADPAEFIRRLDELMEHGKILKAGNTCRVSHTAWNDSQIVIKRYNHKGLIHSLRHTIKTSRARRSWVNGHRLRFLGISTPKPLAYVERWRGPLLWCSYIVTEYVPGGRLSDLLRDGAVGMEQRRERIAQVEDMLRRLAGCRISHGDMKHSNVLIGPDGPVLTDLDGITIHRWRWTSAAGHRRDMDRFAVSCAAEMGRSS